MPQFTLPLITPNSQEGRQQTSAFLFIFRQSFDSKRFSTKHPLPPQSPNNQIMAFSFRFVNFLNNFSLFVSHSVVLNFLQFRKLIITDNVTIALIVTLDPNGVFQSPPDSVNVPVPVQVLYGLGIVSPNYTNGPVNVVLPFMLTGVTVAVLM